MHVQYPRQYIPFAPEETNVHRKQITQIQLKAEFSKDKVNFFYTWQVDYTGFLPL